MGSNFNVINFPPPLVLKLNTRYVFNCIILAYCTNKAVGTLSRDLSKPPQRGQGPDPRPLSLLVGTPLILGPALASRRVDHSLLWRTSLYIFDILFLSPYMFV